MTIKLSGSKNHLIFNHAAVDHEGLVTEVKLAALPVPRVVPVPGTNPVQYREITPEQVLLNAQKYEWEISGEPNNGWYPYCVRTGVVVEEQAGELTHHLES